MENDIQQREIAGLLKKTISRSFIVDRVEKCARYGWDDYTDYVEDTMSEDKKEIFERHYPDCISCLKGLAHAFEIDEQIEKTLSEEYLQKHLEATRHSVEDWFEKGTSREGMLLKAASTTPRVSPFSGFAGLAGGITVDTDTRNHGFQPKGSLVECVAWVSEEEFAKGTLEINAEQIRSFNGGGVEYKIVPPLCFLENKLKALFINSNYLTPFRLNRRHIFVEIENLDKLGFFKEAKSLALSVFVAILSAATGREIPSSTIFSARIRLDGSLQPRVEDVDIKLAAAEASGDIAEVILAEANRPDCPEKYLRMGEAFSVRFFSHIGQVMHYLNLVPEGGRAVMDQGPGPLEQVPKEGDPMPVGEVWHSNYRTEGQSALVKLGMAKGIQEKVVIEALEAVEDLSQMRSELKPLSTALIIGRPESIAGLLPESEIKLVLENTLSGMLGHLKALANVVNGKMACFVFNREGRFHSVRKTNISMYGNLQNVCLLSGENLRYGAMSSIPDSLIFFLTPGGNRVHVFSDGKMVFKYLNGDWERCDLNDFEDSLLSIAVEKQYDAAVVRRVGQIALRLSNRNLGALLVVFDKSEDIEGQYDDCLRSFGVDMSRTPVAILSDEELINFAKEDGAVLISSDGLVHTFKAILKAKFDENLEFDPGIGSRHLSAQRFSNKARCLAVVVSEDGAVTTYCDGRKICRI